MSYRYEDIRPDLFTDEGQRMLLKVRDNVNRLLEQAGAVRADRALQHIGGDTFKQMACLDRLIELGEIRAVDNPYSAWGQHRIYTGNPDRT